jgi:hypothetical protein
MQSQVWMLIWTYSRAAQQPTERAGEAGWESRVRRRRQCSGCGHNDANENR